MAARCWPFHSLQQTQPLEDSSGHERRGQSRHATHIAFSLRSRQGPRPCSTGSGRRSNASCTHWCCWEVKAPLSPPAIRGLSVEGSNPRRMGLKTTSNHMPRSSNARPGQGNEEVREHRSALFVCSQLSSRHTGRQALKLKKRAAQLRRKRGAASHRTPSLEKSALLPLLFYTTSSKLSAYKKTCAAQRRGAATGAARNRWGTSTSDVGDAILARRSAVCSDGRLCVCSDVLSKNAFLKIHLIQPQCVSLSGWPIEVWCSWQLPPSRKLASPAGCSPTSWLQPGKNIDTWHHAFIQLMPE